MPAFETLMIASPIMRFVGTSVMPGLHEIARRTASANDIIDIIDPYLLREAVSLAKQGEAAFLSSAKAPRVAGWHWII